MAAMRCLSIRQPWAWAICAGARGVENRTWTTDYRGQIAIHASSKPIEKRQFEKPLDGSLFSRGAIIGVADLIDVVELSEAIERDSWASGPICWLLENGRLLERPIAAKGKLQLYGLTDDVAAEVREQLALPARPIPQEKVRITVETIRPPALDLCLWRADSYEQLGDFDAMNRMAGEAIQHDPKCGCAYRIRAGTAIHDGEWAASLPDLDEAIRLDGDDAVAWYLRSVAWEELGDTARAAADRQRAIEIVPNIEELVGGNAEKID